MLLFPISILFGPEGDQLFVVVGLRYIHAVLYPFFVFPSVNIAPLVLGPSIRAHSGIPNILKFTCRRADRVVRLCGRSHGRTGSRVSGSLLVLGTFMFEGRGQSNQNRVMVGALLVPIAGRLVVLE